MWLRLSVTGLRALFGTYCEERVENGLKVWYQDSTVEEFFRRCIIIPLILDFSMRTRDG